MTHELLDKLERLDAAATRGPWLVSDGAWEGFDGAWDVTGPDNCGVAGMTETAPAAKYPRNPEANAEFIAEARNALPSLIAEIRRQELLIVTLQAALEAVAGGGE